VPAHGARLEPVHAHFADVTEVALAEAAKDEPLVSGEFVAEALVDVD
jgi:hypothetical protein